MTSVLVCAVQSPFVTGGAEILVAELSASLSRRGFRVDVVNVPFHGHPPSELVRQALVWRLLELKETSGRPPDLVIATKFPSYLVRHPHKVVWLVHQHREAYDLLGSPYCSFGDGPEDRQVIDAIRAMDQGALGECRALYTISRNVAERLSRFSGLPGEPLYPPPHQVGRYRNDGYGDFLFYAGRLERLKRLGLAIEALSRAGRAVRLKLAGDGPLREELARLARRLQVDDRVEFLGFVPPEQLLELYASCRAAYYTPLDEDYGYVTVEALLSGKPVLTTTDAGGPLEFVSDGLSGLVSPPQPEALAAAMDRLYTLPDLRLREMGEEGRRRVAHIGWDHVIDRLTETLR
jgi:glycosyltransferase involved in cell wall biosynthesis